VLTLRPYQQSAKEAVYDHLRTRDDNPCGVIPTAGGKTPIIASICKDAVTKWGGRVLVLAHAKELLEQIAKKLHTTCPELDFGIYSAGLNRHDTEQDVIIAGIQSVHPRACELDAFDLIIVDEAHLIPTKDSGMYRKFLAEAKVVNPKVRVIGFTATPYRLDSGMICGPDNILNEVCYEVGVKELIHNRYICPPVTKVSTMVETDGLHIRAGDFVANETEALMDREELVLAASQEIVGSTRDRHSVLIFASGIDHAQHVQKALQDQQGLECGFVSGTTPVAERSALLTQFREGDLKYLVNVNLLTTGFDATCIDCVAMLRPTMSPGLYYQMAGRGFRLHPGKENCLVLDFGGNVLRHGPVDQLFVQSGGSKPNGMPVLKVCPQCRSAISSGYATCPDCGYKFPARRRQEHAPQASDAPILSNQPTDITYPVRDVIYAVHSSPGTPNCLRVNYRVALDRWESESICLELTGDDRQSASHWWRQRSPDPVPETAERAVEIAEGGGLASPKAITVRKVNGEPSGRIVGHELGRMPEALSAIQVSEYEMESIPF